MPRYFFNIKKDNHTPDTVGVELPDMARARHEAVQLLGADLNDHPDAFWDDEEWKIGVSDENGLVLFTLYCSAIRSSASGSSASSCCLRLGGLSCVHDVVNAEPPWHSPSPISTPLMLTGLIIWTRTATSAPSR